MKKFKKIAFLGLRSALQYRTNYLVGMISILFPLMIQLSLWTAIYSQKGIDAVVFGYTYHQILLYSVAVTVSARFLSTDIHNNIALEIKNGALNRYLVQPVVYPVYHFFSFIGEKIMHFAVNLILLIVMLIIFSLSGIASPQPLDFICYLVDMPIALLLNFVMFLNISFLAFWLTDVSRIFGVVSILITIFSGAILPLDVLGSTILQITQRFPFFYTSYFLVNILSGKLTPVQIGNGMLIQFAWILILTGLALCLWVRGVRRYEAVGG